jgi:dihydrofolate reductase
MIKKILAVDDNFSIGNSTREHGLPWEPIREDFQHFQYETKLLEWLVIGKTTFEIILKLSKGRLLSGRKIVVISRTLTESPHPDVILCNSMQEVLQMLSGKDFMVGGGKQTYESFLPITDEIILTHVHGAFPADCFLNRDILREFREAVEKRKVLRGATDTLPEVTAHYYLRNTW